MNEPVDPSVMTTLTTGLDMWERVVRDYDYFLVFNDRQRADEMRRIQLDDIEAAKAWVRTVRNQQQGEGRQNE